MTNMDDKVRRSLSDHTASMAERDDAAAARATRRVETCGSCEFYDLDCRGGAESMDPACDSYRKFDPEGRI
jgi:hypothetical protein